MPQLRFNSPALAQVFASMCEGVWENRRDDLVLPATPETDPECDALSQLADAVNDQCDDGADSVVLDVAAEHVEIAKAVLENCLDNSSGCSREDDEECEQHLFEGDFAWVAG